MLGPVFCSWVCPWGLISEAIDRVRKHNSSGWKGEPWVVVRTVRILSLSAFLLGSIVLAMPLAAFLSAPRLVSALPLEAVYLRILSPVTGVLLLALLLFELFGPRRLWCRAVCPVGAFANFLRWRKTLSLRVDTRICACQNYSLCLANCAWGIDPRHMRPADGYTNCMRCIEVCPSEALTFGL
jgi:ferredoxin-type protein NapH